MEIVYTARKVSKYGVFCGPYFPASGLNTGRFRVSLRIQSECGKIRTRKNSVFGHFLLSANMFEISATKYQSIVSSIRNEKGDFFCKSPH